jgi:6-phosphogluconolactonase
MQKISQQIINLLEQDIKSQGYSNFIVSGGSSPVKIFEDLSKIDIDWSKVNISLVDDRVVDKTHQDSNEKLVKDVLMSCNASDAKFISICNDPKELAYLQRPYSVMLLGMGEDGHFASLFPKLIKTNSEYFDTNSDAEIFFTDPMGNPCYRRVSMNLSMILESKNIFLLVSSERKLEVLNQAKSDKSLPLYYLLNQNKIEIEIIKDF